MDNNYNNYFMMESEISELRSKYNSLEFKYNKLVELIKQLFNLII